MRKFFLIALVFVCSAAYSNIARVDMNKARKLYKEAATDGTACTALLELLNTADQKMPLLLGYKASATMMMANYVGSPFSKLSYFKKGKQMLEEAVSADKQNVELRLLRYLVQKNTPSFLGYDDNIEEDKAFISNNLSGMKDLDSKDFVTVTFNNSK